MDMAKLVDSILCLLDGLHVLVRGGQSKAHKAISFCMCVAEYHANMHAKAQFHQCNQS